MFAPKAQKAKRGNELGKLIKEDKPAAEAPKEEPKQEPKEVSE